MGICLHEPFQKHYAILKLQEISDPILFSVITKLWRIFFKTMQAKYEEEMIKPITQFVREYKQI